MTTAVQEVEVVTREISEIYRKFFTKKDSDDDFKIEFLQNVARGRIGDKKLTDIVEEFKVTEPHSDAARLAKAIYSMWQWYLHPNQKSRDEATARLRQAGMYEMVACIGEITNILLLERQKYFQRVFDGAIGYAAALRHDPNSKQTLEERKTKIVLAAAEVVVKLEPNLTDYVKKHTPAYALKPEYNLPESK